MRSGRYAYKELNKDVQHLLPKALEEIQLHGQGGHFSHGQITHEKMWSKGPKWTLTFHGGGRQISRAPGPALQSVLRNILGRGGDYCQKEDRRTEDTVKTSDWATKQQMNLGVGNCTVRHGGEMMGSQLAATPPEQPRGAVTDASAKTSMCCLAVGRKASQILGITKKGTGNKTKNHTIVMVLRITFLPLSKSCTCFFGLAAFNINA